MTTPALGKIRTHIIRGDNGINYAVVRYRSELACDEEIWSRTVLLGEDKAHRMGGSAFKRASYDMEMAYLKAIAEAAP